MPVAGSAAVGYGCQTFASTISVSQPVQKMRHYRYYSGFREDVGGVIDEDTVWQAETIHVIDDVTIADGVELVIQPGVQVIFDGFYALNVQGTLTAIGTPDDRIRFISSDPENFTIDDAETSCWNGIRFDNTSSLNDASRLEFCEIAYSKAERGGAFYFFDFSKARIENCYIHNCLAHHGGAFYCDAQSNPEIVGNLVNKCYALAMGSIISSNYSYPKMIGNTFTGNNLLNESEFDNTLPVHNFISKPILYNNIVYGNENIFFMGGQIYEGKPMYIRYNDIEGGYDGEGNIADDPAFYGYGSNPFLLSDDSPCIDSGTLDVPYVAMPETDFAGNPRIHDGLIDIGCYEWNTTGISVEPPNSNRKTSIKVYPNPFYYQTRIAFVVPDEGRVKIMLYNARGQKVTTLIDEGLPAGEHVMQWDGTSLKTGIYFCHLEASGQSATTKIMVLEYKHKEFDE